jgi:hypothetical protein
MVRAVSSVWIFSDLGLSDNLPDNPETMKAMLIAEWHES